MKSIFLSFANILSSTFHSLIDEGVNACTICLLCGAKEESSKVGIETKITPFSLSNSSQFSTIIW